MKKIVTSIMAAALLLSMLAVSAFAADDRVTLSIEGAEGKPGDIVEVHVYMDENPGLWAAAFNVSYNPAYFQLGDVENGDVFSDSAFTKSVISPNGNYWFYAQYQDDKDETTETGLLLTLRFKILETAPNGAHSVSLDLRNGGDGWFIKVGPDGEAMDLTINAGSPSQIRVTDSSATAPATEPVTTNPDGEEETTTEVTGRPATEYVTDEEGYVVRDEDGAPVTQVVTQAVTNAEGETVYDPDGNVVTEIVTEPIPVTSEDSSNENNGEESQQNTRMHTLILIAGIVLLVVAAVIIVIVLYNARKKGGPKGGTDTTDTNSTSSISDTSDINDHSDTEE